MREPIIQVFHDDSGFRQHHSPVGKRRRRAFGIDDGQILAVLRLVRICIAGLRLLLGQNHANPVTLRALGRRKQEHGF